MVILVAIWALQKARDRLTAITRARRHRVRRRWRANNYQLEQPSQSLAVGFKGQSLPRQEVGASVFFPVCCRHALLREQIEGGKKAQLHHSFLLSVYFIHSHSINVYSVRILRGLLFKCYHKESCLCLQHTEVIFILSSCSPCFHFLVALFQVSQRKLCLLAP